MRGACVSMIAMPLPSGAEKRVGNELGSAAMHADARQTTFAFTCPRSCWPVSY
jgi:hypothetical protein